MATWPPAAVPVFPAGYSPLAADFNSWIQANFSFLTGGVVFRARRAAAQSLAGGPGDTVLQFDTIDEDPYSGWAGTPNYQWTPPVTGLYQVTFTFAVAAANNWLEAGVSVTGTKTKASGCVTNLNGGASGVGGMVTVPMTGGTDTLQAIATCQNAASTLTAAGSWPTVEIALASQ